MVAERMTTHELAQPLASAANKDLRSVRRWELNESRWSVMRNRATGFETAAGGNNPTTPAKPLSDAQTGGLLFGRLPVKIVIDGLLGFIVTFGTSACALLSQPHVTTANDVAQAAWLIAAAGAIVGAAKTIQSRMSQS